MLWCATSDSDDGKIDGLKYEQYYWSEKALEKRKDNIKNEGKKAKNKELIHEHSIPQKIIKSHIENLINRSLYEIIKILNKYCHAVIITKEEDKYLSKELKLRDKLPNGLNLDNYTEDIVFSRYKAANIKIFEVNDTSNEEIDSQKLFFNGNDFVLKEKQE